MQLSPGTKLAHYEILEPIGKGGMGEVYRARDGKLGRDVAIKVLPDEFAGNEERLARFKREAKVLASLNHPNIAAIYGLEQSESTHFLVLELVPGETLAERISRRPIPWEEIVDIASQITLALEEAHEQGIVHRDLKPANIKQNEDGKVKVLDYGLAKVFQEETPEADTSMSPTLTRDATRVGVILGTAAYMSPEQAKGKRVDKRADVWAFGAVVYEMITGKRAFAGEDVADTLANVLTKEPEWGAITREVPETVRRLLGRCLDRDAKKRLRDIGEARILLDAISAGTPEPQPPRARSERLGWIVAAASMATTLALGIAHLRREPPTKAEVLRFTVSAPEGTTIAPGPAARQLALSPDGRHLAFAARDPAGTSYLWLRDLDSLEARLLPETQDAWFPSWSPDGRFIGFQTPTGLERIAVSGGSSESVCDVRGRGGATWNHAGVIVFAQAGEGLYQVPASGGIPTPLTSLEPSRERSHEWPPFLPDGKHILYFADTVDAEHRGIYVTSLDSDPPRLIFNTEVQSTYAEPGYLLFINGAALMAQPFDVNEMKLTGEPSRVAQDVSYNPQTNRTSFSVSESGVLAFRTGGLGGTPAGQHVWFDREGQRLGEAGPPERDMIPRLSPDETRVAVSRLDETTGTADIWLLNLERGTESRLTFDPSDDTHAIWSPDGNEIVFASNRGGVFDLYRKAASGAGQAQLLLESSLDKVPDDWSSDGQSVFFTTNYGYTVLDTDLFVVSLLDDNSPTPLLETEASETDGHLSPDGRWLAYVAAEGGRPDVYVRPFPTLEGQWLVSTGGGSMPQWRGDGKELFYIDANHDLVAVTVEGGESFEAVSTRVLFQAPVSGFDVYWVPSYAAAGDGRRFLFNVLTEEPGSDAITVVVNWTAELR